MSTNGTASAAAAAAASLAAPAWRQFQFFSTSLIKDHHSPSSGSPEIVRQPALISTIHSDPLEDLVLLADLDGNVHVLNHECEVEKSWKAYEGGRVTLVKSVQGRRGVVVTIGDDSSSPFPILKIWYLPSSSPPSSSTSTTTVAHLLRSTLLNPTSRPHPISALTISPSLSHIILGLADGTVLFYRHVDQLVDASLRSLSVAVGGAGVGMGQGEVLGLGRLKTIYEGKEPVTGLGCTLTLPTTRGGTPHTTLFILTTSHVLSYPLNSTGSSRNATTQVLDDLGANVGCGEVMNLGTTGERMVVAREEAIYVYGAEGREACYAYEGPKSAIRSLSLSSLTTSPSTSLSSSHHHTAPRSTYLAIISPPTHASASSASATIRQYARQQPSSVNPVSDVAKVTLFDPENKFVAHSGTFEDGVREVWEAFGTVWVLSEGGKLFRLTEQPLANSLSTLFGRNLYTLAISLAQSRNVSQSEVAEIYRRYGDHLYAKSDYEGAMGCYLKTVGTVQASYVIRKFLDAQRLSHLTSYLQELHSRHLANSDHTTLLLNCYTKLADSDSLSSFIHSSASGTNDSLVAKDGHPSNGEPPFDLDTAIRVCRQAGYFDHAVWLAERYHAHAEYLRIQIEDREDYEDALRYVRGLGTEGARESLARYGKRLVQCDPKGATKVLVELCCGGLEKGAPKKEEDGNGAMEKGEEGDKEEKKGYMSYLPYTGGAAQAETNGGGPRAAELQQQLAGASSTTNNRKSGIYPLESSPNPNSSTQPTPPRSSSPPPTTSPQPVDLPSPRQFFAHYVDHPLEFIDFLETVALRRFSQSLPPPGVGSSNTSTKLIPLSKLPPAATASTPDEAAIWNTLLELYLTPRPSTLNNKEEELDWDEKVLQGKAMRLLKARETLPYDETRALLVCSSVGFEEGFVWLYEVRGMYDEIVRYWIDASPTSTSASTKVLIALKRYGPSAPHLYRMVLRYLTTSSDLLSRHQNDLVDILDTIDEDNIMPPIAVVQILSTGGTVAIGVVREYLKKQLGREKEEIDSDRALITSYRTESQKKRRDIVELSDPNTPRIFQVTRCSACGGQLDLPSVHFMCRHSYHQRCLNDAPDPHCPNCARAHGLVKELRENNLKFAARHEVFLEEVKESEDGFAEVARAFEKGIMNGVGED